MCCIVLYCRGKLIYPFPEVDTYVVDLLYLCGSLAAVYRDMLCCHTVKRPRATFVPSNRAVQLLVTFLT